MIAWVLAAVVSGGVPDALEVGSTEGLFGHGEILVSLERSSLSAAGPGRLMTIVAAAELVRSQPTAIARGLLRAGGGWSWGSNRAVLGVVAEPLVVVEPNYGIGAEPFVSTSVSVSPTVAALFTVGPLVLRPRVSVPIIFDSPVHAGVAPSLQVRGSPVAPMLLGLEVDGSLFQTDLGKVLLEAPRLLRRCAEAFCAPLAVFEAWRLRATLTGSWTFTESWSVAVRARLAHGYEFLPRIVHSSVSPDDSVRTLSWFRSSEQVELIGTWSSRHLGVSLALGFGGQQWAESVEGTMVWTSASFWLRSDARLDRLWLDL